MPCNSDYMLANSYEVEISRVACLLDELNGKKYERRWWDGYHPEVYCNASKTLGDRLVQELCNALQGRDVQQCSLEMQIWWRDHQAADKARVEKELQQAKTDSERKDALAKLTVHERKILGL